MVAFTFEISTDTNEEGEREMSRTEVTEKKRLSNDLLSQQRGVLMGISILLIIAFHFTEDCKNFGVHYAGEIRWFWTYIGSSSVDTFLFLSGLGLFYSMKKNPDVVGFYKKRLVKILIPYFLVAFPSWVWLDLVHENHGIIALIKDFTFLSMPRWFWYIFMILACYLIFPYVFHIVESARSEVEGEMWLLSMISMVAVTTLILKKCSGDFYKSFEIVLTRVPIFLAGCFYGRSSYEKRENYWKWGVVLAVSVLALIVLPASMPILGRYIRGAMNISVCAMLAAGLSRVEWKPVKKLLGWFGACSLELYLTHVAVRKIMGLSGFETCYIRNELIMVAVSIILAWILSLICHRLTPIILKRKQS